MPYSSVISSGNTSPRKWALKSSCRQEARTDSCSESKSSWVGTEGEDSHRLTQALLPYHPEPLHSSAATSRTNRPLPTRGDPCGRREGKSQMLGWGVLLWAGWAASSLAGGGWGGVGSPHLQNLVHDFLHDLTLGLGVTAVRDGEEIAGTYMTAEGRTHTQQSTLTHRQNKGGLCESRLGWGQALGQNLLLARQRP